MPLSEESFAKLLYYRCSIVSELAKLEDRISLRELKCFLKAMG